jgi:hypothetical protein
MQNCFQRLYILDPAGNHAEPIPVSVSCYGCLDFSIFIIIFLLLPISGLMRCIGRLYVFRRKISPASLEDTESNRYQVASVYTTLEQNPGSSHRLIETPGRNLKAFDQAHRITAQVLERHATPPSPKTIAGFIGPSAPGFYPIQSVQGPGNSVNDIAPVLPIILG